MEQLDFNNLTLLVAKTQIDFQVFEDSDFSLKKEIFFEFVRSMQSCLIDTDASIVCYELFKVLFRSFFEIDSLRNDILITGECPTLHQKTFYKINTIYQQLKFNLN